MLRHIRPTRLGVKQVSNLVRRGISSANMPDERGTSVLPPSTIERPDRLLKRISIRQKTLLGPGPSNAHPEILQAGALPLLGHLHPDFCELMDDVKEGLKYAFQTRNEWTLAVSGTGHAGMECCIFNLLESGDSLLVLTNGLWGHRVTGLANRIGAKTFELRKAYGETFNLKEIEQALENYKPTALFICHGESSSGICNSLTGIGDLCRKHDTLFVVDAVASLGGVPIDSDALKIDAIYSGSQKCLSAPPGATPVSFGPRAQHKVLTRKTPPVSYYFDMKELANYWGCDEGPRRYHHTAPITSVYQLREALRLLVNEGIESFWQRHQRCGALLREQLQDAGLEPFVEDESCYLPTVTPVKVPEGIDWKAVATYAMERYAVEISGGLGETAGKVWRIGLMGYNCNPDNVNMVVKILQEGIERERNCK